MVKRIFLIIVTFVSVVIAQENKLNEKDTLKVESNGLVYDGKWWLDIGAFNQLPYLTGVFDGLSLGATVVNNSFSTNDICYQIGSSAADDFFNKMDTIKVGHIYEQLDDLYSDTLNQCILFDDAFKYAVYKMSGYEPARLKTLLEMYRKKNK